MAQEASAQLSGRPVVPETVHAMTVNAQAGHEQRTADEAAEDRLVELRARVLAHLRSQGFRTTDTGVLAPVETDKEKVRQLHAEAVAEQRRRAAPSLSRREAMFVGMLADGADVEPVNIIPYLEQVTDHRSAIGLMWRWCALHWSIPVSGGYGRRLRFLVRDAGHDDAVIGVIGLGDPVFAMSGRDATIGWSNEQRARCLTSVMDAFVLGAVPPYNRLLGGKLVALLAGSHVVRRAFARQYGSRQTLISGRDPKAQLALITTASALGRSSVYNRLKRSDGTLAFKAVGYTQGSGDFHFSGAIYGDLVKLAESTMGDGNLTYRHANWTGAGFRNRREVIQRALTALGFRSRALRYHGVRRQVFLNPLASNSYEWLRGETRHLNWLAAEPDDLAAWWRRRWAIPRSLADQSWQLERASNWALYEQPTIADDSGFVSLPG